MGKKQKNKKKSLPVNKQKSKPVHNSTKSNKIKEFFSGIGLRVKKLSGGIKKWFMGIPSAVKGFFVKALGGIKAIPSGVRGICSKAKSYCRNGASALKKRVSENKKLYNFFHKLKEFFIFVDENRVISYPVLILVYTVVVVGITVAADRAVISGSIPVNTEHKIVQEMGSTTAPTTLQVLLPEETCVVSAKCTVEYAGSVFEKKINPSKAEEFGSYFENPNEKNQYMDVVLIYKNTSDTAIRGDAAIKMTSRCDNTEYNCFTAIETDEGKNIEFANNVEIAAGESARIHCIFDVPEGTYDNCRNIMAELVTENKLYIIDVK